MALRSARICDAVAAGPSPGRVFPYGGSYERLASGPSTLGALVSSRSRVHNPACTHTTSATTPAARRMDQPDGAEISSPEPVPWVRPRLRYQRLSREAR